MNKTPQARIRSNVLMLVFGLVILSSLAIAATGLPTVGAVYYSGGYGPGYSSQRLYATLTNSSVVITACARTIDAGNSWAPGTVSQTTCKGYNVDLTDVFDVTNVGMSATNNNGTSSNLTGAQLENTIPSCSMVLVSPSANSYITGSTIYYSTAALGNFTVSVTASDSQTGVQQVDFGATVSAASTIFTAPYNKTYLWTTGSTYSGTSSPKCYDNVGQTNTTSFTVTRDATAPVVGQVLITPSYYNGSVYLISNSSNLSATVSDGSGSGLNSSTCTYTLNNGGAWASTNTTLSSGQCLVGPMDTHGSATAISINVTDNVGNVGTNTTSIVIATLPPNTTISGNGYTPWGSWSTQNVLVTLNCTGNQNSSCTIYSCNAATNDCTPASTSSTGFSYNLTTDGTNYIRYYSTNGLGDNEALHNVSVKVDKTKPTVAIQHPAANYYTVNTTPLNFTATDETSGLGTCWYVLDSGSTVLGCANVSLSNLEQGSHTVTVFANDTATNVGNATFTFFVDTISPTVGNATIVPLYNNGTANFISGTSNISGTVSDSGSGINASTCGYDMNGTDDYLGFGTYSNGTCITTDVVTNHVSNLSVAVMDNASNVGTGAVMVVIPDVAAPTVTISAPVEGTNTTATNTTLSYTVSDGGSGVASCKYSLNGAANVTLANCTNATVTGIVQGTNNLTVYATDHVGNVGSSTKHVVKDTTPPSLTIVAPTNASWYTSTNISLTYLATDAETAVATCIYTLNGTPINIPDCANTSFIALGQGTRNVTLYITDLVGNVNSSTAVYRVDSVAPTVTIASPNATNYSSAYHNMSVRYSVSDATSGIHNCSYVLDAGNVTLLANCSNATLTMSDAAHSLTVYSTDNAGNTGSANVLFTVDGKAPSLAISHPTATTYNSSSVLLNYSATDSLTSVTQCGYSLNGHANVTNTSCTNVLATLNASEGNNTVVVFAKDLESNYNYSTVAFAVNSIAPIVNIVLPVNGTSYPTASVPIRYTVTGSFAACWYKINGGGSVSLGSCANVTLTPDEGAYNITIYANNSVNNIGSATTSYRVDLTYPTVNMTSPTNTSYNSSGVTLAYRAADDVGVASCWYVLDNHSSVALPGCANTTVSMTSNGAHNLTVYANDAANNTNHSATVWFTANMTIVTLNTSMAETTWTKNSSLKVPFQVFNLLNTTTSCKLFKNGTLVYGPQNFTPGSSWKSITNTLAAGINNYTLLCYVAASPALNASTSFVVYKDTTAPSINVSYTSPVSSNTTNVTLRPTDNLAPTVNCSVSIQGTATQTKTIVSGNATNYTITLPIVGSNIVQVACVDITGNRAMGQVTIIRSAAV